MPASNFHHYPIEGYHEVIFEYNIIQLPPSHGIHDEIEDGSDDIAMIAMGGPIGSGVGVMMEVNVTE